MYSPNKKKVGEEEIRKDLFAYFLTRAFEDFYRMHRNNEKFEHVLEFFSKRELLVMLFALYEEAHNEKRILEGGEDA